MGPSLKKAVPKNEKKKEFSTTKENNSNLIIKSNLMKYPVFNRVCN